MATDLKAFIEAALRDIVDGVEAAKKGQEKHINPRLNTGPFVATLQSMGYYSSADGELVQDVHFDVAVTAAQGKGSRGGVGVFVGSIALGTQGKSEHSNTSMSRIKFKVPLSLP